MGKLSHDVHIQHFSHPHPLELVNSVDINLPPCVACKAQSHGWMYICKTWCCNFTLHPSCSQLPQLISHPAHPAHSLSLLPTPAYPAGFFCCDACGQRGQGFSYYCSHCDFDIHSLCASNPLSLQHHSHPCQLQLCFYPPYQTNGFSCDVCRQIGSKHWLYRCRQCSFDVHLTCATSSAIYSIRGANTQVQVQPFAGQNRNLGVPMQTNNQYCHVQPQMSQNNGRDMSGNVLMDAAFQGFVEGAAQQVGQNFVQNLMCNNDSSDGGNGGNSSSSIADIGSFLLTGMFGTGTS